MPEDLTLAALDPATRLAAVYARGQEKHRWIICLMLDQRLAQIVRTTREPLLAQIRLAWWRDRLTENPALWIAGEPLLAKIARSVGEPSRLAPMVDGWEALLGEAPLSEVDLLSAAKGRSEGLLAAVEPSDAVKGKALALRWALADLAVKVSHPGERECLLAQHASTQRPTVSGTALRPLLVLCGLADRALGDIHSGRAPGPARLLLAMRLGLLGR